MQEACEFPLSNATDEEVKRILAESKTIAIVGLSDNPERDSYRVASYLAAHGYEIIPVNPNATEILGKKSYPTLRDIPQQVDVVDIFRKPDAVPHIVDDAIKIGARVVWMQEGIAHNQAADKAREAGLQVVMSKCMMKEHKKAFSSSR